MLVCTDNGPHTLRHLKSRDDARWIDMLLHAGLGSTEYACTYHAYDEPGFFAPWREPLNNRRKARDGVGGVDGVVDLLERKVRDGSPAWQVDAWLRSVYQGQPVPDFEINQQTIDLLHAMATEYFQPSSRLRSVAASFIRR